MQRLGVEALPAPPQGGAGAQQRERLVTSRAEAQKQESNLCAGQEGPGLAEAMAFVGQGLLWTFGEVVFKTGLFQK